MGWKAVVLLALLGCYDWRWRSDVVVQSSAGARSEQRDGTCLEQRAGSDERIARCLDTTHRVYSAGKTAAVVAVSVALAVGVAILVVETVPIGGKH